MGNIQATEASAIDDAVREALAIVGNALSHKKRDQTIEERAADQLQLDQIAILRETISNLDAFEMRQFLFFFLDGLFSQVADVLGPSFIQGLLIDSNSSSIKQRAFASQVLWSMAKPLKVLNDNPEREDVFSLLYTALQGLRLGEVKDIVRPARRKARRRHPYQLAQITWSACVLRELLVTTTETAVEANALFKKGLIQEWDTTRKRCDICRELLGPREATRIENHYRQFHEGTPANERGAQIVAELRRLQKRLREIQTSPDKDV